MLSQHLAGTPGSRQWLSPTRQPVLVQQQVDKVGEGAVAAIRGWQDSAQVLLLQVHGGHGAAMAVAQREREAIGTLREAAPCRSPANTADPSATPRLASALLGRCLLDRCGTHIMADRLEATAPVAFRAQLGHCRNLQAQGQATPMSVRPPWSVAMEAADALSEVPNATMCSSHCS